MYGDRLTQDPAQFPDPERLDVGRTDNATWPANDVRSRRGAR